MVTQEDIIMYTKARELYNKLSFDNKEKINKWLEKSKETFYDNRPFGTRIPPPHISGISQRSMFNLLYGEMQYDQISSPPHTPR